MTTVDLIYFNAGGGHRASAIALSSAIAMQNRPWRVRLVNLFDILDPTHRFKRLTGLDPEDYYNKRLSKGWTLGLAQELKLLQGLIRVAHPALVRQLREHWHRTTPDLVVSLVPNFNRSLCQSLTEALPDVPYVTVMTDLADYPPAFWIEPSQPQHLVCGTPRAAQQAFSAGCPAHRVHLTSGMIIRPEFYRPKVADPRAAKAALGFDPEQPVGLVLFGGQGSSSMLTIAKRLSDVQLILVCGNNADLANRLRALPAAARHVILAFSDDVPGLMQRADFFIGKPGPGTLSEAISQGLPAIVTSNRWTMPQERYNGQWVREHGVGIVLPSFSTVRQGVDQLLGRLDEFRATIEQVKNRAVFEVPHVLEQLLLSSQAARGVDFIPARRIRETATPAHSRRHV